MLWIKDLFRAHERSVNFNVSGCEKFSHVVSESTLQLTFRKLPLVEFWCHVKEEYRNYQKKLLISHVL